MIGLETRKSPIAPEKIVKGFVILTLILLLGTAGYMLIEGWAFFDALYMTVITITTVGYREVGQISEAGRVFTILVIFLGMGTIAYILGLAAQGMIDLQVRTLIGRRRLGVKMRSMKGHYIICGFGRLGKIIGRELKAAKVPVVLIESNPDAQKVLEDEGFFHLMDDATSEEVLMEAGIERARGLISVVASDADNLFITMSARGLNPGLFILARADEEQTEKKLLRAGANRVVMPYLIGGQKMAQTIVKPAVTDFLDFIVHNKEMDLEMGELLVGERSRLKGLTLVESGIRQEMDLIIVAVRKKEGDMVFNPSSQTGIEAGDTLIALGKSDDLKRLAKILCVEETDL